jgi:hypothetical protein
VATLLPVEETAAPDEEQEPDTPVQTIPEERLLTFEWPEKIRAGDSDILQLALVPDDDGSVTPTVLFEGHDLLSERVALENLYDSHLVRAEARLDLAGAEIEPYGTVMQRMLPGEPVIFTWSVSTEREGTIRGNVWLYIRYLPMEGEPGDEVEKLMFTQPVEIQSTNFLGLRGFPARVVGLIGIAISSILGLDDILKFLRWVIRR